MCAKWLTNKIKFELFLTFHHIIDRTNLFKELSDIEKEKFKCLLSGEK
jgi:hypothetical protein